MNDERIVSILVVLAISAAIPGIPFLVGYSSTLEKESIPLNTTDSPIQMNLTDDALDVDISIDPTEDITTPNGTQSISTTGATDIDINDFPPEGVTVIIENKTVTVTENPVTIAGPLAADVAEQAPAAIQNELDLNTN